MRLMKAFRKKIFFGNNGRLDGVSQASFSQWLPHNVAHVQVEGPIQGLQQDYLETAPRSGNFAFTQ